MYRLWPLVTAHARIPREKPDRVGPCPRSSPRTQTLREGNDSQIVFLEGPEVLCTAVTQKYPGGLNKEDGIEWGSKTPTL